MNSLGLSLDEKHSLFTEIKEDITAAKLAVRSPALIVRLSSVDKDLVCQICSLLVTEPQGLFLFLFSFLFVLISYFVISPSFILGFGCGHVVCKACLGRSTSDTCPVDRHQTVIEANINSFVQLKISALKMRCPNFKRGCKVELVAGREFQNVFDHLEVRSVALLFSFLLLFSFGSLGMQI
jgi:hypothetical protein